MKKIIDFTEVVLKKIETIREKEGHKTFSATVHSIVAAYFDRKYFSKNNQSRMAVVNIDPVEDLTQEQICEIKGGKVIKGEGGVMMCEFKVNKLNSVFTTLAPLSMMGEGEYEVKGRNTNIVK